MYSNKNLVSAIIAEDISFLITFVVVQFAVMPMDEETVLIVSVVRGTFLPGKFKAHSATWGLGSW